MTKKILIVEDELKLVEVLKEYLYLAGFETFSLCNGAEAATWVRENGPSLVLLDLMLPGRNGMDICKDIRAFSGVPIIMMTSRIDEIDRLVGLELGADDYICKPFSPREAVGRVKAVLRRTGEGLAVKIAGLTIDESCHLATLAGNKLDHSAVEVASGGQMQAHLQPAAVHGEDLS